MSIAGVEKTPAIVVASEAYADRLEAIWENKRGLAGFSPPSITSRSASATSSPPLSSSRSAASKHC